MWYREADAPHLSPAYSSGGYIHSADLGPQSPLVQRAERESGVVDLRSDDGREWPRAEREWLAESGVCLMVPMIGSDRQLDGLVMLGEKRSEEPYSRDDLALLRAIARQLAAARERARLKERVDRDRRVRHDVLSHLETGHFSLLRECPSCGACYDSPQTRCAADGAELALTLPVERTIDGKYRPDRLIGKGGMGAVYEAADLRLVRKVAVKIMLGRAFGDRESLRRFEREAQASARLAHPNIVTVFDFGGVGASGAFLVMELVAGRTLRIELQRTGRLDAQTVASWFEQICGAVDAAHRAGIVHRDLKPENVIVTTSPGVPVMGIKVLDFGLAKMSAVNAAPGGTLTSEGLVVGTVGYMSPEQLTGGNVDGGTDVFALGVMAAEAVTGRRPFVGKTPSEILVAMERESVTIGGDGAGRRVLETVLRRAVAKDAAAVCRRGGSRARSHSCAARAGVDSRGGWRR